MIALDAQPEGRTRPQENLLYVSQRGRCNRLWEKEEIMNLNRAQRQFWEVLLAYYHQELEERQDPAMVSMLGFFHGEEQALADKRLAEEGRVYLL
jgi:hypothetical protein